MNPSRLPWHFSPRLTWKCQGIPFAIRNVYLVKVLQIASNRQVLFLLPLPPIPLWQILEVFAHDIYTLPVPMDNCEKLKTVCLAAKLCSCTAQYMMMHKVYCK